MVNATNKVENKDVQSNDQKFTTVGGQEFTHFAKGRYWGKELYADLVAPSLKSDLATETWQNGAFDNVVPTFCPPDYDYTTSNILDLKMGDDEWKTTQDHSKWAITTKGFDADTTKDRAACIGGINRQYSQEKRGGATMCIENEGLNDELYDAIVDYEDCP
jgi:deoxyribonuclease-2